MDPLWVIVSITCLQVITSGALYFYDEVLKYFGSKDDTTRYFNGEISWWQVRDTDAVTWKRIEECNKAVATKNMPFINSFLCLIQSWKLKVKVDAINLVKDAAGFISAHDEFCVLLLCLSAIIYLARLSFLRWRKDQQFDDGISYKSSRFKVKEYEDTIFSEKICENIDDMLKDWGKLKKISDNKRLHSKDEELTDKSEISTVRAEKKRILSHNN